MCYSGPHGSPNLNVQQPQLPIQAVEKTTTTKGTFSRVNETQSLEYYIYAAASFGKKIDSVKYSIACTHALSGREIIDCD